MKKTKKIMALCMVCMLLLGTATSVSAKTLAESFSSSVNYTLVACPHVNEHKYKKSVCAKTTGYTNKKKYHHVLAYIGGSNSSTSGADAVKRSYGYGNITATATHTRSVFLTLSPVSNSYVYPLLWKQSYFNTGYAKYGMGK